MAWFLCDLVQCIHWYGGTPYNKSFVNSKSELLSQFPTDKVKTLSANVRNTVDISNLLGAIRSCVGTRDKPSILPVQEAGHYIHGTLPRLYVAHERDRESVLREVVRSVKEELFGKEPRLSYKDLAGITRDPEQLAEIFREQGLPITTTSSGTTDISSGHGGTDSVWVGNLEHTPSREWPAVLGVYDVQYDARSRVDRNTQLSQLYSLISRARVHCTLLLLHNETTHEDARYMFNVFLKPHVLVKTCFS